MSDRPSLHDQRDDSAFGPTDGPHEGASACSEIGCDDRELTPPVWDVFKTLVFVVVVCGGVAALISWIR